MESMSCWYYKFTDIALKHMARVNLSKVSNAECKTYNIQWNSDNTTFSCGSN